MLPMVSAWLWTRDLDGPGGAHMCCSAACCPVSRSCKRLAHAVTIVKGIVKGTICKGKAWTGAEHNAVRIKSVSTDHVAAFVTTANATVVCSVYNFMHAACQKCPSSRKLGGCAPHILGTRTCRRCPETPFLACRGNVQKSWARPGTETTRRVRHSGMLWDIPAQDEPGKQDIPRMI